MNNFLEDLLIFSFVAFVCFFPFFIVMYLDDIKIKVDIKYGYINSVDCREIERKNLNVFNPFKNQLPEECKDSN